MFKIIGLDWIRNFSWIQIRKSKKVGAGSGSGINHSGFTTLLCRSGETYQLICEVSPDVYPLVRDEGKYLQLLSQQTQAAGDNLFQNRG